LLGGPPTRSALDGLMNGDPAPTDTPDLGPGELTGLDVIGYTLNPTAVPEPAFYQFAAVMALSGMSLLRRRRK